MIATSCFPAVVRLPLDIARCTPSRECQQRCNCARALAELDDDTLMVDASICIVGEGWCPMFIDRRGVELLGEA